MSLAVSAPPPRLATPQPALPSTPVREVLPWAVFIALPGMLGRYFVSSEGGAPSR